MIKIAFDSIGYTKIFWFSSSVQSSTSSEPCHIISLPLSHPDFVLILLLSSCWRVRVKLVNIPTFTYSMFILNSFFSHKISISNDQSHWVEFFTIFVSHIYFRLLLSSSLIMQDRTYTDISLKMASIKVQRVWNVRCIFASRKANLHRRKIVCPRHTWRCFKAPLISVWGSKTSGNIEASIRNTQGTNIWCEGKRNSEKELYVFKFKVLHF